MSARVRSHAMAALAIMTYYAPPNTIKPLEESRTPRVSARVEPQAEQSGSESKVMHSAGKLKSGNESNDFERRTKKVVFRICRHLRALAHDDGAISV